jgi:hypothetical protein
MERHRNSRVQGDAGLGQAIAYFTGQGNTVCIPLTDSQKYDLIVELDGQLKRVQVRTTTRQKNRNSWELQLKTCGGNKSRNGSIPFDNKSCDLIFAICGDDCRYLIPTYTVKAKVSLLLGGRSNSQYRI